MIFRKLALALIALLAVYTLGARAQEASDTMRYEGENFSFDYPANWRVEVAPASVGLFWIPGAPEQPDIDNAMSTRVLLQRDFITHLSNNNLVMTTEPPAAAFSEDYVLGYLTASLGSAVNTAVSVEGGDTVVIHEIETVGDLRVQRITSPNAPVIGVIVAVDDAVIYSYARGESVDMALDAVLAIAETLDVHIQPSEATEEPG